MRTLLITGPGGSGRTTTAAATALTAAREGTRTLLLGTDRTDTLGPVLGDAATPHLTVRRVDPDTDFRTDLAALQDRAASALDLLGASRLDPEEIAPLPGAEELAVLRALRDAALPKPEEEAYDLVVVDLPPTPRALSLLALPEELRRYLRRLLPPERQAARALRPVLGRLAGVPMPAEWLYGTAARLDLELAAVEAVLADRDTLVRLVAEPGPSGADAVRAAALGLALRGLRVDALVATRVLPESEAGGWLAGPVAQQRKTLEEWQESYAVHPVTHLGRDPRGWRRPGRTGRPRRRGGTRRRLLAGHRLRGRRRRPRLAHPPAGRPPRRTRPDPARRRARRHRGTVPPHRPAALRAAPLHRRRRRPARGRTARPLPAGSGTVAAHPLKRRRPFG
ncbi:conserved hypothetical protein [Streptomyces griseoflavus Tu4000]|uniref:ArsA/GET3 Anion-transporting ATPase-like domain-containing protein n=1 Tax=Streptomyces griseoflavus Tu4000 TaxID=467200 RepID=D9XMS6_9ACTN|nr:conserved hypothetical protein [Streptomyces griseoflavus Tu4000]